MPAPLLIAYGRTGEAGGLVDEAVRLGTDLGAPLLVLHIVTDREVEDFRDDPPPEGAFLDRFIDQIRAEIQRTVRSRLPEGHPGVEVEVHTGDPATRLLEEIARREPRYVLLGVRSRSRVGKFVFGSNAQALILGSTRPVLCVPIRD